MNALKESVKKIAGRCLPGALHLQFGDYLGFVRQAPRKHASTFQFYRDFESVCNTTRDVNRSRQLHPALKSFDAWLAVNASKIPLD